MVATRKSLPNVSVDLPDESDRSIPIDVRRLFINGKDTMRGAAPKPREEKVYHWRGAVYAITDDTPQEWLDQEPEKWKNKDVKDKQKEHASKRERSESLDAPPVASRSSKRKSTGAVDGEAVDEEQRVAKRPRKSMPAVLAKSASDYRPAKRRSLPTKPTESPLKFDFSRRGGQNVREHVEDEKKAARKKGYIVDALPPLKTHEERRREAAEYAIVSGVRDMAGLNTKIARLREKYDALKTKQFLEKQKRLREEQAQAQAQAREAEVVEGADQILAAATDLGSRDDHTYMDDEDRSQLDSQLNGSSEEPITDSNTQDALSSSTRQESIQSNAIAASPGLTGASSDTTPPPEEPESDKSMHENKAHSKSSAEPMLTRNRGGQNQRWSLPKSKPPQLSDQLDNVERAESAIHRGRLAGESKQARRRRIRRELAIMRGWAEEVPEERC